MKRSVFLLGLAVLLLGSGTAMAGMLDADAIDTALLLPPPPASGSAAATVEVAELHAIAAKATPAMLAAAARDDKDEGPDIFNAALGFDLTRYPAAKKLLEIVGDEEEDDTKAPKALFHRARPWIVDASLQTCSAHKPGPALNSYPSGHSTRAFMGAVVLAALLPSKAQAVLVRAHDYAENRLICGYHFRSDIVAGQALGSVLAIKLMQAPAFMAQFQAAQTELAAAHLP